MNPSETLEDLLSEARKILESKTQYEYPKIISSNIDTIVSKIDKNKSLISALVTSIVKKISNPEQDIRLHRKDFSGGYSARSLDTAVTTPFFKKYFPKYANKESSFLTLATREKIKWTKKEGKNLKIRDKEVKRSFLEILDAVQSETVNPKDVLIYIFIKLHLLSLKQKLIFDDTIQTANTVEVTNIESVLKMLEKHFEMKMSSRLPVIAIFSIYQQLFKEVKRYEKKILRPLNVHTSSDKHGYGDIEIWNTDGTPYEMVEIKHKIPIDRNLIFDIAKKSEGTTIERYYILTTAKENFISSEEEEFISKFIMKIKRDSGLEIIANGIYYSLKYYLRFIDNYQNFINAYTENLIADAENSTEITETHIAEWKNILKEHHLNEERP